VGIVYESATGILLFLTPLFGVVLFFIIENIDAKKRTPELMAAFIYILFFEIDKNFVLFSFIAFFILYYTVVVSYIRYMIDCNWCYMIVSIVSGYMGYYALNFLLKLLGNSELPTLSPILLWYIFLDICIAFILMKKFGGLKL
jgi:hypothetical protein